MNQIPFIKKFKVDDKFYIYDVNSNSFFQTDSVLFENIDRPLGISECCGESSIVLKSMVSKGYFSNHRPEITYFHQYDEDSFFKNLRDTLDNKIGRISLVVTENCNLRCKYCAYSGSYFYHRSHSTKAMDSKVMRKAIDFYFSHSQEAPGKNISFYGGEPLTNFDLLKECVEYVRQKSSTPVSYNMTTNGTLLNTSIMTFFVENQFSLLISIDGPEGIHDRNRIYKNGKGSFKRIYRNLKTFKQKFPDYYNEKVRFNVVISPPFDYKAINKFLTDPQIKPRSVRFSSVNSRSTNFFEKFTTKQMEGYRVQKSDLLESFNQKLLNNEETEPIEKHYFSKKYMEIHQRNMDVLPSKYPSNGQCLLGDRVLLVNVDGSFNFCTQIEDVYSLGNVFDGYNYEFIYDIYRELNDVFKTQCFGCWAIRLCMKCIKDINENGKISKKMLVSKCESIRAGLLQEMKDYIRIRTKNPDAFNHLDNMEIE